MKEPRLTAAFVLPPLVPVLGYFGLVQFMSGTVAGAPSINPGFYLFWLLAIAYLMTLLIWLPIFMFLRSRQLNTTRNLILAGASAFFLVSSAASGLRPSMILFCFISAAVGALYGFVFCKIAGRKFVAGI